MLRLERFCEQHCHDAGIKITIDTVLAVLTIQYPVHKSNIILMINSFNNLCS